jgi:ribonuclease HI
VCMVRRTKVFFDGGCRPNPGRIEVAVVVRGVEHLFHDLGSGTSRDAEWLALIAALRLSQDLGLHDAELTGDAADVVRQANLVLSTNLAESGHAAAFKALAASGPPARIRWTKRQQNLAGIALARQHPR